MSFVLDQVRRIDAQLDRLQLSNLPSSLTRVSSFSSHDHTAKPQARILALQAAIRGLCPSPSDNRALLQPHQIQFLLSGLSERSELSAAVDDGTAPKEDGYESELEWLLASKATTQVYGLALESILDSTVKIADDIWYWDEVLSSRRYTGLYSIQTSPLRLYDWGSAVWDDVKARGGNFSISGASQDAQDTVRQSWHGFYKLVQSVIRERGVEEVHKQMLSPVTRIRNQIREKQKLLKNVRLRNANALGVLLGEGLANESVHGEGLATPSSEDVQHKWKASVCLYQKRLAGLLSRPKSTIPEYALYEMGMPIDLSLCRSHEM